MQLQGLYRGLYTKYAPGLSQEELDKKLEYASTIDPNEFINGFYQKYTGQGPNQEQVDYMNSMLQQPEVEEEEKPMTKDEIREMTLEALPGSFQGVASMVKGVNYLSLGREI